MSDDRILSPQERCQLAAEQALGLLQGEERSRAVALARDDQDFRGDVACWRGRFAPWLGDVVEVEPPERVWSAIEQRIGARAESNVIQLKRRVGLWRGFAAAASTIAAALALILIIRPQPPVTPAPVAQPAPLVATLASDQTADRVVATWDPARRSLIVAAAAGMPAKAGKDHELWVIPAGGKPVPVGVMHAKGPMRMTLPMPLAMQLKSGAMLAISVEPAGGSRTGLPTGPVIASGALEQT
jgi:anti-sigma-K factor RskA